MTSTSVGGLRRTFVLLLLLAAAACATGATRAQPAARTAPPPPVVATLDACQRALLPLFASARVTPEILLLSADSDAEARSYDAWLRELSTAGAIAYRWVSLDDPRGKELARALGLRAPGVVVDVGVDHGVVQLGGPAAIASAVREALHVPDGATNACDAAVAPRSAAGTAGPSREYPPREPLVASAALARATTLRIDEPTRSVTLVKDGATWKLASGERADEENVRHALDDLTEVRLGAAIVKDSRADAWLGLDRPHATHVVVAAGGQTLLDLTMGRSGKRGTAVRIGGAPEARVAHLLGDYYFKREARFWRDRAIWTVDPTDVRRVEITNGRRKLVLSRRRGGWRATLDGRRFPHLDGERVDMLLRVFRRPFAEDFAKPAPETGLDKPSASLRFVMTDGSAHALQFGAERPDHTVYVQEDGAATVYLVTRFQASFADASPARWRRSPAR